MSDWSQFALTQEGIYFIPRPSLNGPGDYTVRFFSFSDEKIQTIARLEKFPFLGLTVSPDGWALLFSQIDQSGTDLMLTENFR